METDKVEQKNNFSFKSTDISQKITKNDEKLAVQLFQNSIIDRKKMPLNCPEALIEELIQKYMKKKYSFLKDQQDYKVNLEDLYDCISQFKKMNPLIQTLIQEIKEDPNIQLQKMYAIKKQIVQIDIYQLERLIKKTQKTKQQIRNQQIILMIGTTGSGKTTTILKALGYILKEGLKGNLKTLVSERQLSKEHQPFLTSPESKSITRFIFAAKIPKQCFSLGKQKQIYICDSPGFGDSAGVQVDIANGVGMIQGICECKSVRIALVVSAKNWGDRGQGIKQLGKTVSGLFNDYDIIKESVSFIFNKFTKSEEEQLQNKCTELRKNLNELQKGQIKYCSFLQHLNQIASEEYKIMMEPQKMNTKAFIKQLIRSKPIKNPSEHFKYNFTDKTKHSIKLTIKQMALLIMVNFEQKKYDETIYYFKKLKLFVNLINSFEGKIILQNCQKKIIKKVKQLYDLFEKQLKQNIRKNQINTITIMKMKQNLQQIEKCQNLNSVVQIQPILKIQLALKLTTQCLLNSFKKSDMLPQSIYKLSLFAQKFNKNLKIEIDSLVLGKFNTIEKNLLKMIKEEEYEAIKQQRLLYTLICKSMCEIGKNQKVKQVSNSIQNLISNKIDQYIEVLESTLIISINDNDYSTSIKQDILQKFINKPMTQKEINQVNKIIKKLTVISESLIVDQNKLRQIIKKIFDLTIKNMRNILQNLNNTIFECQCANNLLNHNICKKIKNCQTIINKVMNISQVNETLISEVKQSYQKLKILIEDQKFGLNEMIQSLKCDKIDGIFIKLKQINQIISFIKSITGENEKLIFVANKLEQDVEDGIKSYLISEKNRTKKIFINLKFWNADMVRKNLEKLDEMLIFEKNIKITVEIKIIIDEINNSLYNNLLAPIDEIRIKSLQTKNKGYYTLKTGIDRYEHFSQYINFLNESNYHNYVDLQINMTKLLLQISENFKDSLVLMTQQFENKLKLIVNGTEKRSDFQDLGIILKIVNNIVNKINFSIYLHKNYIFNYENIFEEVKQMIYQKQETLRQNFKLMKNEGNFQQIHDYYIMSNNLSLIDKHLPQRNQNLKQLIKQIETQLQKLQGNVLELIDKAVLLDKNEINCIFLKQAYEQIQNNNSKEIRKKKKQIILNKLLEVNNNIKKNINKYQTKLELRSIDKEGNQLLFKLYEQIELAYRFKQNIEKIITDEIDLKFITIDNQFLNQIENNIFQFFIEQYQDIINLISLLIFEKSDEKIKNFQIFEKIIIKIIDKNKKIQKNIKIIILQPFWKNNQQSNNKFKDNTINTLSKKLKFILKIQQQNKIIRAKDIKIS